MTNEELNREPLNQPCLICKTFGVRYVKTKAGFAKLCADCREKLKKAGLLVPGLKIRAWKGADQ